LYLIIVVLIRVAFLTLLERNLLGYIQIRKGPNKVGFKGIVQPMSDGIKLFIKERVYNYSYNKFIFLIFPFLLFILSIICWLLFIFGNIDFMRYDMLYFILISGLSVYGLLGGG